MATVQASIETASREVDTLTHLEERIQKTVALVTRLRGEKSEVETALASAKAELDRSELANLQFQEEIAALRAEKLQVRSRLEKLLGHIDQLGAV